jgi:hypothetical protein
MHRQVRKTRWEEELWMKVAGGVRELEEDLRTWEIWWLVEL